MSETKTPSLWETYRPVYDELAERALGTENVSVWLHDWSELDKELSEQSAALSRRKNENTRDKVAEKSFMAFVREVVPPLQAAEQKLKTRLLGLEGYKPETEHEEFIKRFRNESELFRNENGPLLAEEAALSSEYDSLVGGLMVQLDGETLTVPETERRLLNPDRNLREGAWRAIQTAKLGIADALDDLFLKLFRVRREIAQNAGFSGYRDYRWRELNRFDYTPEDSRQFHAAIASEVVPLIVKLREERRLEMNLTVLRPWDAQVDLRARPALEPFGTSTDLEDGLARIFGRLNAEFAEQFNSLRDGWLDLEAREGKVPGLGYQSFFPKSQKPYIYWSTNGTHRDVWVLVHEGGHAFHSLASAARNDLAWNLYPGMEFAEVASQTMELLALPYLAKNAGGFYSGEDAARARQEGLERVLGSLPRLALNDAFQHWYAGASKNVTTAELDAKWLELSNRFDPGLDWSGLEPVRAKGWHDGHIFTSPFYMLEYAFAWLGAVQIWQNALHDPQAALKKYRAALALGGTRPLPELFEAAGARFAFDRETVGELMRFVYAQR